MSRIGLIFLPTLCRTQRSRMHTTRIQGHRVSTPHATARLKSHSARTNWIRSSSIPCYEQEALAKHSASSGSCGETGTTTVRSGTCGRYGIKGATLFEQHDLNGRTTAFILATGCYAELYDCCEEGDAGTLGERDHNTRNEMLKLFTEHHTGLSIQPCLRDEELGRAAISCHYAVDCLWGKVAMCGPQERVSTPTEHGLMDPT